MTEVDDVAFVVERATRDPELARALASRIRKLDQPKRSYTEEELRRGGERIEEFLATQWSPSHVKYVVEWVWGKEAAEHLAKLDLTEHARKAIERAEMKRHC